jgi:hypothetical protein
MNQQTATVSFYTFDKTRTQKYQMRLSLNDAVELFNLVKEWKEAMIITPQSKDTTILRRQVISSLDKNRVLSKNALDDVIHLFSDLKNFQECTPASSLFSRSLSFSGNRGTVLRCSISSNGSGLLIPAFLFPRPRIATFWIANSGTTFETNIDTKTGFNASGPHLGLALGFIGIGISIMVPGVSHFVIVGYAYIGLLFGKNIDVYPPTQYPNV